MKGMKIRTELCRGNFMNFRKRGHYLAKYNACKQARMVAHQGMDRNLDGQTSLFDGENGGTEG